MDERSLVFDILSQWEEEGFFHRVIARTGVTPYAHRVSKGVVENMILLDHIIRKYVKRSPGRAAMRILRMAFYELIFNQSAKEYAVTDEANRLAAGRARSKKGLINAVIRNFLRDGMKWSLPAEPEKRISVEYSMPLWIVRLISAQYGREKAEKLFEYYLNPPYTDLHVTGDRDRLLAGLRESGAEVIPTPDFPENIRLRGSQRVESLPGYRDGSFFVQDAAAQAVASMALPVKGALLDVGSAPGGKSAAFRFMDPEADITALDISPSRMKRMKENLQRLQIDDIRCITGDFLAYEPDRLYDCIFIDAPCSGLGVMGKKPDIKYRVTEDHIEELKTLQSRMLDKAAELLAPGGRIVYATCTLNRDENEGQVDSFLARRTEFELDGLKKDLKSTILHDILTVQKTVLFFPPDRGTDGMFGAVIRRRV